MVGEDKCQESVLKDVGEAADVFMFASDQLPSLVEAGAIARLRGIRCCNGNGGRCAVRDSFYAQYLLYVL